eukprot:5028747-Pyramimonas_sp.AAC.2
MGYGSHHPRRVEVQGPFRSKCALHAGGESKIILAQLVQQRARLRIFSLDWFSNARATREVENILARLVQQRAKLRIFSLDWFSNAREGGGRCGVREGDRDDMLRVQET